MNLLIRWLASALVIFATAYAFPAIKITDFKTAVIAAVVLGLINLIIRPVVKLFTLPINILTLGLFTLVINAAMIMLADYFCV
jgi:putative membrane protein